jgi:hypothetical protein
VKRSVCEEVRSHGAGQIAQLERQEKTCKDEDSKRTSYLGQAKKQTDRTRLAALKGDLAKFDLELTCTQLRPAVTEGIAWVKVKLAQIELKRHGCFNAAADGIMNDGTRKGGWDYSAASSRGDNSNSQFAVLALYEAERAGVAVDATTWRLALTYWGGGQNGDFSWGYYREGGPLGRGESPGTGSMTCAGVASIIMASGRIGASDAKVAGDNIQCCGEQPPNEKLDKAMAWLGRTFTVHSNPATAGGFGTDWLFYYLYGVERVGRLTGQRFLVNARGDKHDWYREGAEMLVARQDKLTGKWEGAHQVEQNPIIGTSLALLFMSKGRRPVLIGKLQHGATNDWNHHRADVANLTLFVESKWRRDFPIGLSWQVVDLNLASVEDLLQAPVLFMNGSQAPDISAEQAKRLRDFLDRGGTIFAEATCSAASKPDRSDANPNSFDAGFRRLMERVFEDKPEHRLKLLSPDHPVWKAEMSVAPDQQRPLLGIDYGCRTSVIYAPPPWRDDPPGNL